MPGFFFPDEVDRIMFPYVTILLATNTIDVIAKTSIMIFCKFQNINFENNVTHNSGFLIDYVDIKKNCLQIFH